jgi:hypothetical protein
MAMLAILLEVPAMAPVLVAMAPVLVVLAMAPVMVAKAMAPVMVAMAPVLVVLAMAPVMVAKAMAPVLVAKAMAPVLVAKALMDIDTINAASSLLSFDVASIGATVTHPGGEPIEARAIVNRAAEVRDERGVFVESRCEISLLISETGAGQRGTVVDTGKPGDCWELKSQLYNDGIETGWTAGRMTQ